MPDISHFTPLFAGLSLLVSASALYVAWKNFRHHRADREHTRLADEQHQARCIIADSSLRRCTIYNTSAEPVTDLTIQWHPMPDPPPPFETVDYDTIDPVTDRHTRIAVTIPGFIPEFELFPDHIPVLLPATPATATPPQGHAIAWTFNIDIASPDTHRQALRDLTTHMPDAVAAAIADFLDTKPTADLSLLTADECALLTATHADLTSGRRLTQEERSAAWNIAIPDRPTVVSHILSLAGHKACEDLNDVNHPLRPGVSAYIAITTPTLTYTDSRGITWSRIGAGRPQQLTTT